MSIFQNFVNTSSNKGFVRSINLVSDNAGNGGGSLQVIGGNLIDVNAGNFNANNASFANGTIILGQPDADHAVFGANEGPRYITSINQYSLKKGTYITISSVCGEATDGSIQLPEDPDNNEDLIIQVSTDGIAWTSLPGRITENNSSNTKYITFFFQMTEDDNNYFIRVRQTDDSGDDLDYFGFKDLYYNRNINLYFADNEFKVFM